MEEMRRWMQQHKEEMLEDMGDLIRVRSVAGPAGKEGPFGRECREALNIMLELGRRYGFGTVDWDGYCGEIRFGQGSGGIGVWGHLDVVPEGSGWSYPPYELTVKDGFLIGRGVQDNKGPLMAVLYAMRFLKESGYAPKKPIRLIFGCDEEDGMEDVDYFMAHAPHPEVSFVADCGFPVCRGEKGILRIRLEKDMKEGCIREMGGGQAVNIVPDYAWAELETGEKTVREEAFGIAGHAAFTGDSRNAIYELCRKLYGWPLSDRERNWIETLEELSRDGLGVGAGIACEDADSGKLTCNLGRVQMMDGRCEAELDIRYPVTAKSGPILEVFERMGRERSFQVHVLSDAHPFCMGEDEPLIRCLLDTYHMIMKDDCPAYVMGGGTYAKKIPHAAGFGPGLDQHLERLGFSGARGQCHSADEAQLFDNLELASVIYAEALKQLDKL